MNLGAGKKLVKIARAELNACLNDLEIERWDIAGFNKKSGVFVSLYSFPEKRLKGCIGFPVSQMPLWESVREAAKSAAFEDIRFSPLKKEELNKILIEISVLTKPKVLKTNERKNPEDIFSEIEIGKDGLILEYSGFSGLFLPQVPVEQKWDIEHFLQNLCTKAGVSPKTWRNNSCKIYKFQAQIFSEVSPNGEVKEVKL